MSAPIGSAVAEPPIAGVVASPAFARCDPGQEAARPPVVVVAADELDRCGVAALLSGSADVCGAAGTLGEAIEQFALRRSAQCVAVIGPSLPDAPVGRVLEVLSERARGVVAIFRPVDARVLAAARRCGVRGFFDSHATADELGSAIQRVDGGDVAIQPSLAATLIGCYSEHDDTEVDAALTPAQRRILELLALGYSSKEVARHIHATPSAVNHMIERATRRLNAVNRTHAVARALRLAIID